MMAGNPNSWWSLANGSNLHPHQESDHQLSSSSTSSFLSSPLYLYGPSSSVSSLSSTSMADHQSNQDFPRSWSQLLLSSGLPNDQERYGTSELSRYNNRVENWEENGIHNQSSNSMVQMIDEKQEVDQNHNHFGHANNDEYHNQVSRNSWPQHQLNLASSPTSCVISLSSNLLNFSSSNKQEGRRERSDNSTEGINSSAGGLPKKARVQHSSTQPALKVRKEKLGDRITALHQLVSPFGKTDTASVLSEAIGYIRFLLAQIEGLSSPYLGIVSKSMGQHYVQERNCLYPTEAVQDGQGTPPRDLKSRGLCLVPVSCTQHVGNDNDNGADYFAPALGGGF